MPQPIDPQTELGRITAAERIQQIATRTSLVAQARADAEAIAARVQAESQVKEPKAKNEEVDRELKRRSPFSGRRRRGSDGDGDGDRRSRHFYDASEKDVIADDPEQHALDIEI